MELDERQTLVNLLAWYREMGVGDATVDEAVDWLSRADAAPGHAFGWPREEGSVVARGESPAQARPADPVATAPAAGAQSRPSQVRVAPSVAPPAAPVRRFPTAAPDAAEQSARQIAAAASTIPELAAALARFDGCGLKATAKSTCVWRGAERASLMIVGEAPGRDEDLEGKPFVGRAGQLLDKMLASIGLDESKAHITNIIYWRPPGNRTPTPHEALICRPFLLRQMELVAPQVVLALGGAAAKQLFDVEEGIMKLRGKWRQLDVGGQPVAAMATLHPAYLLRTPAAKRLVWRDLLSVAQKLGGG